MAASAGARVAAAPTRWEAVKYARPFVIGRSPWDKELIAREYFTRGIWNRRAHTGNFAFAGVDQALWDLCAQSAGQPLYQLLGGALREEVEYFYYLSRGAPDSLVRQCTEGRQRGYGTYYLKVGLDRFAEETMLEAVRATIGPSGRIRIDANEAWTVNEAVRTLNDWDRKYGIDFCEAPIAHDLPQGMAEIRARVPCAISANEALGRESDVVRLIRSRAADVLCFGPFWVGSLRRFMSLGFPAHLEGQLVCKRWGRNGAASRVRAWVSRWTRRSSPVTTRPIVATASSCRSAKLRPRSAQATAISAAYVPQLLPLALPSICHLETSNQRL